MSRSTSSQAERLFRTAAAWERWLAANHDSSDGLWLRMAKKASGVRSVRYEEALDVALCYGWIDGQAKSVDETFYVQRFTPRRKRSTWSKRNTQKVAALIEAGRMRPAGLAEVERAKADGRWDAAYDPPSTATVPDDLAAALDAPARAFFDSLDSRNRYAVLHRVRSAVKPETRARRIEQLAAMLREGRKLYP